jgi:predicted nucleic acid-binding protein
MSFVVDASVVGAWLLPDEDDPAADALLRTLVSDTASAPALLRQEFANVLVNAIRRKRLGEQEAVVMIRRFEGLPIAMGRFEDLGRALSLALRHGLTAYDASYLALAMERSRPLASLDKRLRRAAEAEGVAVLPGNR